MHPDRMNILNCRTHKDEGAEGNIFTYLFKYVSNFTGFRERLHVSPLYACKMLEKGLLLF